MRPSTRSTRSHTGIPSDYTTTNTTNKERSQQHTNQPASLHKIAFTPMKDSVRSSDRKKPRHKMTTKQLQALETLYQKTTHPERHEKQILAGDVGM